MELRMKRKNDQMLVLEKGVLADDFMTRLKGLMGKTSLIQGEGMLFPKCNNIHMWMMKMPIDVVFLKKEASDWQILALYPRVKPWKVLPLSCLKADDTLELPAGSIERLSLQKGQTLCIA